MPTYVTEAPNHEVADLSVNNLPLSKDLITRTSPVDGGVARNKSFHDAAAPTFTAAPATAPVAPSHPAPYKEMEPSMFVRIASYFGFFLVFCFSHVREIYRYFVPYPHQRHRAAGYAPMVKDFDDFWQRRVYRRSCDCWNRPIDSRPSRVIGVMERVSHNRNATLEVTGKVKPAVNLGSYNYLGFAEDTPHITHEVLDALETYGIASCSAPQEAGQHTVVTQLEEDIAEFVGHDAAIVCGMGFGTNFGGLPGLFGSDALVLSDALNHSSIVQGVRASGATVKAFPHSNFAKLETMIRDAIVLGKKPASGSYVPYSRIVIIVEGVYSMEGEIVDLAQLVELKKKYGVLLFVDEAHSIGALGRTGRGVCEHCGVNPRDVDILMGTFTKSFGSIGGYLSGDRVVMDYLRTHSAIALHCDSLSPACAQQALSVLNVIRGRDGTDLGRKRIEQLKENARFLRQGLVERGYVVLGDDSSPVIPVMIYALSKLGPVSRKCLSRGLAVVVVGYPATPLLLGRIRLCVSAAHTRADLQFTLDTLDAVDEEVRLKLAPRSGKALKAAPQ